MPPSNFLTAVMAVAAFAAVARAFWPLIWGLDRDWLHYAARGLVILSATVVCRSMYWDVLQFVLGDTWTVVRTALGGQQFSTVFNIGFLAAAYQFLMARLLLIPEDERRHWRWWSAWAHPGTRCLIPWRRD